LPVWGLYRRGLTAVLRGRVALAAASALVLVLLAPPVRRLLESSMTVQMLAQLPLLAACGVLLARAIPARAAAWLEPWNHGGVSGLILASVSSAYWMLPRALDAGVTEPWITFAKFLALPLLTGLPLALAWPRMTFIVKGVLTVEVLATLFRLGWLYLASPDQLCNLYRIDDQQRLGCWLLALGGAATFVVAARLLFGRFAASPAVDLASPHAAAPAPSRQDTERLR
jgi:hypothetical protein